MKLLVAVRISGLTVHGCGHCMYLLLAKLPPDTVVKFGITIGWASTHRSARSSHPGPVSHAVELGEHVADEVLSCEDG